MHNVMHGACDIRIMGLIPMECIHEYPLKVVDLKCTLH